MFWCAREQRAGVNVCFSTLILKCLIIEVDAGNGRHVLMDRQFDRDFWVCYA